MTRKLLFVAILVMALPAYGGNFPAPFGLTWKMGEQELHSSGFRQVSDSGGLKIYESVSVPKAWSKADRYFAVTHSGELVKVSALSKSFTDDVYGIEGKGLYNQMKSILSEKYGPPKNSYEVTGRSLYDERDEFYQCLDYSGCGTYFSIYEVYGGTIGIRLVGERRGQGYLNVSYESPYFSEAKEKIRNANTESDTEAF